MRSLLQALKNFAEPGPSINVNKVIATFPISPPVSITHFLRLLDRGGVLARLNGRYAKLVNELDLNSDTLVGLVDVHTHPAAHLGFGTELFYGPPDGDPSQVFGNCNGFHGGPGFFDNQEGNEIRRNVVDGIASQHYSPNWDHKRSGWPDFPAWPTWHDRLHQQVRVEMLERAWKGGLRLIVAHAVNSHTLAKVSQTRGPYDDKSSGDAQIAAIKEMVSGQAFMELALSPSDLRQIIGRGHLAVIIGVELDCIGNFYTAWDFSEFNPGLPHPQPAPSDAEIQAEITRLFSSGVRYFFPVHVTDNVFGGAALYEMTFNTANRYQFGSFFEAEPAPASSLIGFTFNPGESFWKKVFENIVQLASLGFDPQGYPPAPPTTTGHRNARGLQHRGQVVLDALMRVGAMIDVDHMGEKTVLDTLAYTKPVNYPVFAGHNLIRDSGGNERAHLIQVATEILDRGGVFGIGTTGGLSLLAKTISQLRNATSQGGIALGSDCSGMEQLPAERSAPAKTLTTATDYEQAGFVVYNDIPGAPFDALQRCQFGNRKEDIDSFGFSHIGMYPDFIEDGISSGLLTDGDVTELFNAPESVTSAWESCLNIASRMG
jgi:microsomal dipeptidase-like Zn-dependent dipeptidase